MHVAGPCSHRPFFSALFDQGVHHDGVGDRIKGRCGHSSPKGVEFCCQRESRRVGSLKQTAQFLMEVSVWAWIVMHGDWKQACAILIRKSNDKRNVNSMTKAIFPVLHGHFFSFSHTRWKCCKDTRPEQQLEAAGTPWRQHADLGKKVCGRGLDHQQAPCMHVSSMSNLFSLQTNFSLLSALFKTKSPLAITLRNQALLIFNVIRQIPI